MLDSEMVKTTFRSANLPHFSPIVCLQTCFRRGEGSTAFEDECGHVPIALGNKDHGRRYFMAALNTLIVELCCLNGQGQRKKKKKLVCSKYN